MPKDRKRALDNGSYCRGVRQVLSKAAQYVKPHFRAKISSEPPISVCFSPRDLLSPERTDEKQRELCRVGNLIIFQWYIPQLLCSVIMRLVILRQPRPVDRTVVMHSLICYGVNHDPNIDVPKIKSENMRHRTCAHRRECALGQVLPCHFSRGSS